MAPIPRERWVGVFGGRAASNHFVSRKLGASPIRLGASWGRGKQQNPQHTQPNLLLPQGLSNILPIWMGSQQLSLPKDLPLSALFFPWPLGSSFLWHGAGGRTHLMLCGCSLFPRDGGKREWFYSFLSSAGRELAIFQACTAP